MRIRTLLTAAGAIVAVATLGTASGAGRLTSSPHFLDGGSSS